MNYTGVERRKYQRFKAAIPLAIGLIDLKGGNTTHAQFKGITTDISKQGLGLELHSPASEMLPVANKLMGEKKHFNLEFTANLGNTAVRGIGEVRWARIHPPSGMRMGVFLKEMIDAEKEKWTNHVTGKIGPLSRHVSGLDGWRKHTLVAFFPRLTQDLITSPFSVKYILPPILLSGSVIIYWLTDLGFYYLILSCGICIILILLTKSRIFSRYPKPRSEIPQWVRRKSSEGCRETIRVIPQNKGS